MSHQAMLPLTHFRVSEAINRWRSHQKDYHTNREPYWTSRIFSCGDSDGHDHAVCLLTRFNLRNDIYQAPARPNSPVQTDNVIEKFFCWEADLPAPGAKKPRSLYEQAQDDEAELASFRRGHRSDRDVDKPCTRLIEVLEYPGEVKQGHEDKVKKLARNSVQSRYFVEKPDARDYDTFTGIYCQKDISGVGHLSLKACIILVCKSSGKQWEVNFLG